MSKTPGGPAPVPVAPPQYAYVPPPSAPPSYQEAVGGPKVAGPYVPQPSAIVTSVVPIGRESTHMVSFVVFDGVFSPDQQLVM